MADSEKLAVEIRKDFGSPASRRLRKAGRVPCVVYSSGNAAVSISADRPTLEKAISSPHIISIDIDGETKNVLVQDSQWEYLTNSLIHVDFKEIRMDEKIRTSVPLVLNGEAVGVSQGGDLDQMVFEVEVECLPGNLPEKVELDISELGIGDSVGITDLVAPENVEIVIADETVTLVHVTAPRAAEEAAEGEAEGEGAEGAAAEEAAE